MVLSRAWIKQRLGSVSHSTLPDQCYGSFGPGLRPQGVGEVEADVLVRVVALQVRFQRQHAVLDEVGDAVAEIDVCPQSDETRWPPSAASEAPVM